MIQIVIDISEERFRDIQRIAEVQLESNHFKTAEQIIAKGTPQPKTGHWEDCSNGWMCSECERDNCEDTKYCPNCGAKMESEDKCKDGEAEEEDDDI